MRVHRSTRGRLRPLHGRTTHCRDADVDAGHALQGEREVARRKAVDLDEAAAGAAHVC